MQVHGGYQISIPFSLPISFKQKTTTDEEIDIGNLFQATIQINKKRNTLADVRLPKNYHVLYRQLVDAVDHLPEIYNKYFSTPFLEHLEKRKENGEFYINLSPKEKHLINKILFSRSNDPSIIELRKSIHEEKNKVKVPVTYDELTKQLEEAIKFLPKDIQNHYAKFLINLTHNPPWELNEQEYENCRNMLLIGGPDYSSIRKEINDLKKKATSTKTLSELTAMLEDAYPCTETNNLIDHLKKKSNVSPIYMKLDENEIAIAKSIISHGETCSEESEKQFCKSVKAVQEMINDLYIRFLEKESSFGITHLKKSPFAPIHSWKNSTDDDYSYPLNALEKWKMRAPMVVLPVMGALANVLDWTFLAHKIFAINGLESELKSRIIYQLKNETISNRLIEYWAKRINGTASDVLGTLNLGPAAAFALIASFRAIRKGGKLQASEKRPDKHPTDLLRAILGAYVVKKLPITKAKHWAKVIKKEALKDYPKPICRKERPLILNNYPSRRKEVMKSIAIVVDVICQTKLKSLQGYCLMDVRTWNEEDERHVIHLRETILHGEHLAYPVFLTNSR